MERRGLASWRVRFDEVEPDRAAFFARFGRGLARHPVSGGFGTNPPVMSPVKWCFGSTGRTSRLQRQPTTNMPAQM